MFRVVRANSAAAGRPVRHPGPARSVHTLQIDDVTVVRAPHSLHCRPCGGCSVIGVRCRSAVRPAVGQGYCKGCTKHVEHSIAFAGPRHTASHCCRRDGPGHANSLPRSVPSTETLPVLSPCNRFGMSVHRAESADGGGEGLASSPDHAALNRPVSPISPPPNACTWWVEYLHKPLIKPICILGQAATWPYNL